ncbi:MAG: ATP-binding protein [Ferruginibacter sp.]
MKKTFLFLLLLTITILATAQTNETDKLKKELNNHTQQDTFRVNRLNALATNVYLNSEEREKFAREALAISDKINYEIGKGNALMLLGSVKNNEGNHDESKLFFLQADSIAKATGDLELQANVLWRMAASTSDGKQQEAFFLQADSVAKKSGNLELLANVFMERAVYNSNITEDETLILKADSIAKKTGNLELQQRVLYSMGGIFEGNDNKKALSYFLQAENMAKKSGNKVLLSTSQNAIGSFYQSYLSDYAKAMEYTLKGLHNAEETNYPLRLISSWMNLGTLYSYMGDQDIALIYLLKAENANKRLGNKLYEAALQNAIGERYRLMGKYPEAIIAYNKADELDTTISTVAVGESNLADVYTRMGNLPLAFQYAFSSLKKSQEAYVQNVGWVYGILSRAYLKKNMADSAIYYGGLGMASAKETGSIEFMRDNTLALSNAYAAKKDFEKAYINRLLYINYRDSMMNEEVRNKTAVQQYTFSLDKKEAQINTLGNQKKYQRNLLWGAMALLILILASAGLLLYNNRQKQKANKLLQKQKLEIDEKAAALSVQKENVELLNDIGRKITASLSVDKIIGTVYQNVNTLMDANVFGIGIYNDSLKQLEFPATYENGEPLPFYTNNVDDKNRFGAVCFKESKEIIINNLDEEYKDHIQEISTPDKGDQPVSVIFLPLTAKGEKLGVITVQSFKENAYSEYQLFMFRNIATYTAIAIENAESYETLNETFSTLKSTQTQLVQSEKMASLGELTAGIAHEIQNPLNFVNNFSEVNKEMIDEMQTELKAGNTEEAIAISNDIKANEEKINHHGKRADAIVKGMLQHSRSSTSVKEPTDINALCDEYLRLSYHGLRTKDKSFNATMKTDFDESIGKINIIPQDIGRVILNLINNAFYAVGERIRQAQPDNHYQPTVSVTTKKKDNNVIITVNDNGNGIPQKIIDKIFQPFFTTKPTGQGTGLGLSLSYDIVKAHGGDIKVESKAADCGTYGREEGTSFLIFLPIV